MRHTLLIRVTKGGTEYRYLMYVVANFESPFVNAFDHIPEDILVNASKVEMEDLTDADR